MLLNLAADDPGFKAGMSGVQIGAIVAGIGVAGAGVALIFGKSKQAESDAAKLMKKIVGGVLIAAGIGVMIYGFTFN